MLLLFENLKRRIGATLPYSFLKMISFIWNTSFTREIPDSHLYKNCILEKNGIEIGGPSSVFRYSLPLYEKIENLDIVNFSHSTVWERNIKEDKKIKYYRNKSGIQIIADGTDLSNIENNNYDFVLSSNCLEHIANPLKALFEWKRILKNGGFLILVLPNPKGNFDHARPITTFAHMLADFNENKLESDLTHLEEILALHDLSLDPSAGDFDNFKKRCLDNFDNRTLHHHVFDLHLISQMIEFTGFKCLNKYQSRRDFYFLAAKDTGTK